MTDADQAPPRDSIDRRDESFLERLTAASADSGLLAFALTGPPPDRRARAMAWQHFWQCTATSAGPCHAGIVRRRTLADMHGQYVH